MHLGILQMKWHVKGVKKILVIKVIVLNPTSVQVSLYFNIKMPGKQVSKYITYIHNCIIGHYKPSVRIICRKENTIRINKFAMKSFSKKSVVRSRL